MAGGQVTSALQLVLTMDGFTQRPLYKTWYCVLFLPVSHAMEDGLEELHKHSGSMRGRKLPMRKGDGSL
jgi:hypothetical protein